jgi:hypothetical protein
MRVATEQGVPAADYTRRVVTAVRARQAGIAARPGADPARSR